MNNIDQIKIDLTNLDFQNLYFLELKVKEELNGLETALQNTVNSDNQLIEIQESRHIEVEHRLAIISNEMDSRVEGFFKDGQSSL